MIAAIYDRDHFCQEQVDHVVNTLSTALKFAHIHSRKEIENYLSWFPLPSKGLLQANFIEWKGGRKNVIAHPG